MNSEPAIAPPATPVAGIDPPPVNTVAGAAGGRLQTTASPRRSAPVRLARKAMSVLRGDKYMVGAYPPEWGASSTAADAVSARPPTER